jgi:hypothetical protein
MPEDAGSLSAEAKQRWAPRYKLDAPVEIEWGSTTVSGQVRDISRTGMFISPTESLWIGARFSARILLQPVVPIECTVTRVEPGRGIGVQMYIKMPEAQTMLDALIVQLESRG